MTKQSVVDTATGRLHVVKGAIRQKAGELTGQNDLEADGYAEKVAGKVLTFVGKVEKHVSK
jgi:uncharacterized protein YjbJ (UPF0337 family)